MDIPTIQLERLDEKRIMTIPDIQESVPEKIQELISAFIRSEVKKYNEKRERISITLFLTTKAIQEQSERGKIAFGDIKNEQLTTEKEVIKNALAGFKDGLFLVFTDLKEITDL